MICLKDSVSFVACIWILFGHETRTSIWRKAAQTEADTGIDMYEPSSRLFSHLAFLWPALAATSASEIAATMAKNWTELTFGDEEARGSAPAWTTENTVALDLNTVFLRDFSTASQGIPVLLCAPFALHGATVTDFAPGHSLVAALQAAGLKRLFVTEWRSATPDMRFLTIDDYLAALNVLVDELGGTVDLIGLCQGGWLSLLYAARFPAKVRKLVIAGAPVDIAAAASSLSTIVNANPLGVFEELVRLGGGRVLGQKFLTFWSPANIDDNEIRELLQTRLPQESGAFAGLAEAYRRWHAWTVDLPGTYYLEVIDKLYRHNALASGHFVALGKTVDLSQLTMPLYMLAAREDELVAPPQLLALEGLVGTPAEQIVKSLAPGQHLSLFVGKNTLKQFWPGIARWLSQPLAGTEAGTTGRSTH